MSTTLDTWRTYLANSLEPMVTIGTTQAQREFAEYQTGYRILEMREYLEHEDTDRLLGERGITPAMEHAYVRAFLAEAREYVKREAEREQRP